MTLDDLVNVYYDHMIIGSATSDGEYLILCDTRENGDIPPDLMLSQVLAINVVDSGLMEVVID